MPLKLALSGLFVGLLSGATASDPPSARNVQARLSGWMLLGSAPASLCGVALATWLHRHYGDNPTISKQILGAVLIRGSSSV